jgi:hypothetical protein
MTEHNPVPVAYISPAPKPPKAPQSRRVTITIIVMVLALAGLTLALLMQYRATQDAANSRDVYQATLADTKAQVTDALGEVEHYKNLVNDQNNQLASCAAVVEVSDHEFEQVMLALRLGTDYLDDKYIAASAKLDEIGDHTEAIGDIVSGAGHDDLDALWDECSPEHSPL